MDFTHGKVQSEYQRWRDKLGDEHAYHSDCTVGIGFVLKAHFLLVDAFLETEESIGGVGPRDLDLLHSAVARQHTAFGNYTKWKDMWERCATLMFGLIKNHPFHDANKRTALLVGLAYLHHFKHVVTTRQKQLDRLVVAIADNKLNEFFDSFPKSDRKLIPSFRGTDVDTQVYQIAEFLRRNCRRLKHDLPLVTFQSLNQALKEHGFELANANGNYIDIIRWIPEKRSFFGRITPPSQAKLGQVGFPSWKAQVSRNAMRTVREVTGLNAQNGCDADVLLHGEEPLSGLISEYIGPLRRLAYK